MAETIIQTAGGPETVKGHNCGSFFIHMALDGSWKVTHRASGLKFPYHFETRTLATRFAKDVERLMDWPAVKIKTNGTDCKWVKGKPSAATRRAIGDAAVNYGAL